MDARAEAKLPGFTFVKELLITSTFVLGVIGNIAALWILKRSARHRNKKHVLMLTCLATIDLISAVGMLTTININKIKSIPRRWICVSLVVMRAFGIASGCVALVMAVERWLALTRPFLYQQFVTYKFIRNTIFILWTLAFLWSYLPFAGFGLYYENGYCARYKDARSFWDLVYAYMFLVIGCALCLCIALCNLSVIWELLRIRQRRVLIRRVSKSMITNKVNNKSHQTPEEIAFAKLMAILCIIFICCWGPQMVMIIMSQLYPKAPSLTVASKVADMLMCGYFTIDPFVYVIFRYLDSNGCKMSCCFSCTCTCRSPNHKSSSPQSSPVTTPTSIIITSPSYSRCSSSQPPPTAL